MASRLLGAGSSTSLSRRWLVSLLAVATACLLIATGAAVANPEDNGPPGAPPEFDTDDFAGNYGTYRDWVYANRDYVNDEVDAVYVEVLRQAVAAMRDAAAEWREPAETHGGNLSIAYPALRPVCATLNMALTELAAGLEGEREFRFPTRPLFFFTFTAMGPALVTCSTTRGSSELDPVLIQLDENTMPAVAPLAEAMRDAAEPFSTVHGTPVAGPELRSRCRYTDLPAYAVASMPAPVRHLPVFAFCQVAPTPEVAQATADAVNSTAVLSPVLVDGADALSPAVALIGPIPRPACAAAQTAFVVASIVGSAVSPTFSVALGAPVIAPVFILCAATFEDSPLEDVLEALDVAMGEEFSALVAEMDESVFPALQPVQEVVFEAIEEDVEPFLNEELGVGVPGSPCPLVRLVGGRSAERNMPAPTHRISLLGVACDGRGTPQTGGGFFP